MHDTSTPATRKLPRRAAISRGIRLAGVIPAGLLFTMAGFIALFFDDATESDVTTYWIALLLAGAAIGVTVLSARIGFLLGLVLLVPCALLADSFHGAPFRIFGFPAFPLSCIALILLVVNAVAFLLDGHSRTARSSG